MKKLSGGKMGSKKKIHKERTKQGRGKVIQRERSGEGCRLDGLRAEGCAKEQRGVKRDGWNDEWRDGERESERESGRVGAVMGRPPPFFISLHYTVTARGFSPSLSSEELT